MPEKKPDTQSQDSINIIINEIQLLLAEKRTSLSTMRTGIAVFVLPLSVLSFLIATSKYYDVINVMHLMIPLLFLCVGLVCLGTYLVSVSMIKIKRFDKHIMAMKAKHSKISEFLD
jgi:uncharacterized membrane protein YkgB